MLSRTEYISNYLSRILRYVLGVLIVLASLMSFVSLLCYNKFDPSWNTSSSNIPSNVFSYFGSYSADILMQLFGKIGSNYLVIALAIDGFELLFKKANRLCLSIICSYVFCVFIHSISKSAEFSGLLGWFIIDQFVNESDRNILMYSSGGILCILMFIRYKIYIYWICNYFANLCNLVFSKARKLALRKDIDSPETNCLEITQDESKEKRIKKRIKQSAKSFILPSTMLLKKTDAYKENVNKEFLTEQSKNLMTVLNDFGIHGEIISINPGPVVTLFELKPAAGIKSSRVIGLASDIARYMSAVSVRVAVIPGKNALGIELPNRTRQTVFLRPLLESKSYLTSSYTLPIILGRNIGGSPIVADLSRTPHLLIAGTTGSGKSVGVNAMILSLLYKLTPEQCRFIMIDPKMLELSVYNDIPHLLLPVVTDPKKAVAALKWTVKEMENRYLSMSKIGVRNIEGYNEKVKAMKASGSLASRQVQTGFDSETGLPIYEEQVLDIEPIPYIVVVVDEMADLMLVAGKDIEIAVQRLAQMARAAGIHLIMATQRPSVDVITGTIKANFPTRISFHVSSKIDSRTILGEQGAEQLLGQGDMLYLASGGRALRVHGPFVGDAEVENVVNYLKRQGSPRYIDETLLDCDNDSENYDESNGNSDGDELYNDAVNIIKAEGKVSTSFLQRRLKIGYNRAARIVDLMEKRGVVSPANHIGKREILR